MTSKEEKVEAIRIIKFNGTKEDWPVWEQKFLTRSKNKGYRNILNGKIKAPKDSKVIDSTTDEGKEELKARKANDDAYEDLILSIEGDTKEGRVAFGIVKGCKTKELTDGDANLAWTRLTNKYESKSIPSMLKLKKNFTNSKFKDYGDPDEWITVLEEIQTKILEAAPTKTEYHISDESLMMNVINGLPRTYDIERNDLEKELENGSLDITALRLKLSTRHERLEDEDETHESEEEESAMTAQGGPKRFKKKYKGRCKKCGKYGHKSADCRSDPSNSNNNWYNNNNGKHKHKHKHKFKGKCNYCGMEGHKEKDCWKKQRETTTESSNITSNGDLVLAVVPEKNNYIERTNISDANQDELTLLTTTSSDIWIGDTGSTCHLINDDSHMFDIEEISEKVKVGNGESIVASKKGKVKVKFIQKDKSETQGILVNVKYAPKLWCNLFSIVSAISQGWNIGNQNKVITLSKNGRTIKFDNLIHTKASYLAGIKVQQLPNDIATMTTESGTNIDIKKLHKILHHCETNTVIHTGSKLGLKIQDTMNDCESCAKAKAKQKKMAKVTDTKSNVRGERLFMDISTIKQKSYGGGKHWLLAMDDSTDVCWSHILKQKSDLCEKMLGLILDLKAKSKAKVKFIRCDNAPENKKLEEECKKRGLGITFEYTAVGTPQQNGKVERKFATLASKVRATLNEAGLEEELRIGVWAECVATTTLIENILVKEKDRKGPYEKFYRRDPAFVKHLRQFGEIGIVAYIDRKMKPKFANKGRACMFVGYATNHAGDVYRMLDLNTKKITMSRDIKWLNKTYGEWKDKKVETIEEVYEDSTPNETIVESTTEENQTGDETTKERAKLQKELEIDTHEDIEDVEERSRGPRTLRSGRELRNVTWEISDLHVALMMSTVDSVTKEVEPITFKEAWWHENLQSRNKWRNAIRLEFSNMNKRIVWLRMLRAMKPEGKTLVKCKWVFKIKRNGTFRARLVACGYSQVPGVDYTENYSPVINDVTFRIMLTIMMIKGWTSIIIDIETAFLEGDLDEEIYMNIPEGYYEVFKNQDNGKESILKLLKPLYGLVQAARLFWKKMVSILTKELNFKAGKVDPCLLTRSNERGTVMIALYVDDCLCIGNKEALETLENELNEAGLKTTVETKLTDYLSCEININENSTKGTLRQPHLIKNLESKFGKEVENMQRYQTPGTPGKGVVRPEKETDKINPEEQKKFRSGVGMLLYLVKHSRPDIANAVRELSKSMDGATLAGMKELRRVIKYVLDTKMYGLKLEPEREKEMWKLIAYTDSDWAGDKETRISVSGYILYFVGVPIAWRSKAQTNVTLSSSEAEYVSLSECVRDVRFVMQLLTELELKFPKPVVIKIDNVGAMFMSENISSSTRTRHVDIRLKFVNEFIEEGEITVVFVKSEENDSDVFTKNTRGEVHEKLTDRFMSKKSDDGEQVQEGC